MFLPDSDKYCIINTFPFQGGEVLSKDLIKNMFEHPFWHRKKTFDWRLALFGLIALGIVISVAILLVIFVDKAQDGSRKAAQAIKSAAAVLEEKSPINVQRKYQADLISLREEIVATPDWNKAVAEVEKRFFTMRVPAGLLDSHLEVFWKLNKIKESGIGSDKQAEMSALLDELIKKVENL